MRSRIVLFALLSATLAFFAGCQPTPRPTPPDTNFGHGGHSADWIDPTTVYGSGAEGLTMRDQDFSAIDGNGSQRIENMLQSVYFDTDKAAIPQSERSKILEAADYLKNNLSDKLLIEGYCDWRGTREYNLTLGDRRANGVKQYLMDQGIDPDRLQTLSHGDLTAEENASAETMKKDRRASLVIIR